MRSVQVQRSKQCSDPSGACMLISSSLCICHCLFCQNTVLIGHSSGAVAGLRLLESHPLKGLVLVSACHTDLGMESEAISGYYPRPDGSNQWKWDEIPKNVQWIVQFHSEDDPFIPIEEARFVKDKIKAEVSSSKIRSARSKASVSLIICGFCAAANSLRFLSLSLSLSLRSTSSTRTAITT